MENRLKEIILIRHGEAQHHLNGMNGGWTDSFLSPRGHAQARRTAQALPRLLNGNTFSFYTSDLQRASQTAEPIAEATGIQIVPTPGLREFNNGQADGMTREQAKAIGIPISHPTEDWIPYPGAESWRLMEKRVSACMDQIARETERAIIVSHGNSSVAVVHWWLGLGEPCWKIYFEFDPCSITRLTISSFGERTISKLNDTAHLQNTEGIQ